MNITKYSVVIVEHSTEAFLVKCGYCKSSGYASGKCEVCSGIGKVWLKVPSEWSGDIGVLKCGYCKGSGYASGRCRVCHGVGSLVKCFPRVVCSYCDGSGYASGRCSVCGGVGSVWVEKMKSY